VTGPVVQSKNISNKVVFALQYCSFDLHIAYRAKFER
jgi:hypothetical protein